MTTNDFGSTPPYGEPGHQGPQYYLPNGQIGGYTGADFPAPDGVPLVSTTPAPTATKPRRGFAAVIVAASLSAVIGAGAGIGSYTYLVHDGTVPVASAPVTVTTQPAAQTPPLDGTISAAAAKIEPSVVTITVESGRSGDIGSGVVLDTSGHILTNNHVVEAASSSSGSAAGTITVTFHDGQTAKAKIIGTSETNDLAVIKVDGVKDLKPATFASSSSLVVGQSVVAAGAPLGLSESVTSGIVSNTARPVRSGSNDDAVYLALQTDAAINPGNSGGPLVDLNGAVVGINSSIASTGSTSDSTSQSGNIGIGFAIPADVVTRVANDLITTGSSKNAALGVTVGGSDTELSTATGVTLQTVVGGKAASEAGLRAGDVVTRVNDFDTTTPDGLIAATRFYAPGTKVTVTYTRDRGEAQSAAVTLGSS